MSQTPTGIIKMRETIRRKYGLTADGKSALHVRVGAIGGSKSGLGGFYWMKKNDPERLSELGSRGGSISRRKKPTA